MPKSYERVPATAMGGDAAYSIARETSDNGHSDTNLQGTHQRGPRCTWNDRYRRFWDIQIEYVGRPL